MKVWITRPTCDEVFTGGFRKVLLWVDKPCFDQRPYTEEYELFDPEEDKYVASVWRELGWTSVAGSVPAKPFLKQSEEILDQVWQMIRHSVSSDLPGGGDVSDFNNSEVFLDARHEARCAIHWKRFLLEIDLKNETVSYADVMVGMEEGSRTLNLPLSPELATTSHFLNEDINQPFDLYAYRGPLELKSDRIW